MPDALHGRQWRTTARSDAPRTTLTADG